MGYGLRMILAPGIHAEARRRYRTLRHVRRMGPVVAVIALLLTGLAHALLPLESPAWQGWQQRSAPWFAHLNQRPYKFADPLRYLLQSVWVIVALLLLRLDDEEDAHPWLYRGFANMARLVRRQLERSGRQLSSYIDRVVAHQKRLWGLDGASTNGQPRRWVLWGVLPASMLLFVLLITQPLALSSQFVFVVVLFTIARSIRRVPGRFPVLVLIVLSLLVSGRYIWWRYTATLYWNTPQDMVFGLILVMAETYSWLVLVLGYMQTAWPLHRSLAPLPDDEELWPVVDVFIPTYNEDLNVVRPTVYAAAGLDWPAEKLCIHLLDDGDRPEFRDFAERAGVMYRVRPDSCSRASPPRLI